ncbi:hypothetical protein CRE_23731 [Caenorhabditis remanei]|uniref:Uncharacterized protein n=2 Tax=Caenorhabditis TaxID=6237 RepID=E3ND02_CAERE|nr:hypothetical protein CRE_23731 [Caenorhabditis remanei]
MKFFSLVLAVFFVMMASVAHSFNVPPTGLCYVPPGGDCYRCDCKKPATCYKGTCR